ncbi:MAG: dienelactone hydrolase family protein [Planctomycetota bacterium]|nr:dienelactone hydrolase family protein [Planctomycetota bacterium]
MLLTEDHVDLETPSGTMRTYRFQPADEGRYPGLALWSEIYQVTGPIQRVARALAGEGFIVAAPEVYHEFEPPGSPFQYDKPDTDKGNKYKIEKEVKGFDHDARAVLDHLKALPRCSGRLGSIGLCLGGHLSFRCGFNPDVLATACFYATDIHSHTLGKGKADDTLARCGDIQGELLLIWGRQDPHIPLEGRRAIYDALCEKDVNFTWHEFNAQHAFMRDEGYRYNPALGRLGMGLTLETFQRVLQAGAQGA